MARVATKPKRKSKRPPRKPGPGRDTKLTPECQARVVELLKLGTGRMRAARGGGIDPATFFRWLKEGEENPRSPKRAFCNAVREAEDSYHEELVTEQKRIALQGESDSVRLQAINRILERRYAEDWSARTEVRHAGPTGGAVQVEDVTKRPVDPIADRLAGMTPEQLDAFLGLGDG
jgi:hypothetical protein